MKRMSDVAHAQTLPPQPNAFIDRTPKRGARTLDNACVLCHKRRRATSRQAKRAYAPGGGAATTRGEGGSPVQQ